MVNNCVAGTQASLCGSSLLLSALLFLHHRMKRTQMDSHLYQPRVRIPYQNIDEIFASAIQLVHCLSVPLYVLNSRSGRVGERSGFQRAAVSPMTSSLVF